MCIHKIGVLIEYAESETGMYTFYCPACKRYHPYNTIKVGKRPCWTFNGDMNKPTFSPSLRVFGRDGDVRVTACHLFVRDGKIEYCNDCPHELAGKTVDMIPVADVSEDAF